MSRSSRQYQNEFENDIFDAWSGGERNVCGVMSTGGGKTYTASSIIERADTPTRVIAHRQELISQWSLSLAKCGIRHDIISPKNVISNIVKQHVEQVGKNYYSPNHHIKLAGVDTLVRRTDHQAKQVGLWVTDECHHLLAPGKNKWGNAIAPYVNARGLGVTATPCRSDGQGLGRHADGVMDVIVEGPPMRWLIDNGYLSDYEILVPPNDIDFNKINISSTTGEFTKDSLSKTMRQSHIVGDVVQHYINLAGGRLGVTFTPDVDLAEQIADQFNAAGVPAVALSAKTPDRVRWDTIRRFARREILQLVNCALFDEGFDLPAIEVVSMARATCSYGLYSQTFGRGLRIMDGKDKALILDHVGNIWRHGLPDAPRVWTLDRREKRTRSEADDAIPLKACKECFHPYERYLSRCPYCGYEHIPQGRGSPEQVDGELQRLDPEILAALRGKIDKIDGPAYTPKYANTLVERSIKKNHKERQDAQQDLRYTMMVWGGRKLAEGLSLEEAQRLFYYTFGIDVLTAQTLGRTDANKLTVKIEEDKI